MAQVSDILIRKDNKWHSMRGSMILINGEWKTFKEGCGIYHNGTWHTLKRSNITVDIYISLSVAENREGIQCWHLTVSATPDVITTGECDITIEGSISMSDTAVYNINLTTTIESERIDTHIPYTEGIEPSHIDVGVSFSNDSYHLGTLHIL
jgi:hypothetical protein